MENEENKTGASPEKIEAAEEFLSIKEAARFLGVTLATMNTWRVRGCGPRYVSGLRTGKGYRRFYHIDDLKNFKASRKKKNGHLKRQSAMEIQAKDIAALKDAVATCHIDLAIQKSMILELQSKDIDALKDAVDSQAKDIDELKDALAKWQPELDTQKSMIQEILDKLGRMAKDGHKGPLAPAAEPASVVTAPGIPDGHQEEASGPLNGWMSVFSRR